MQEELCSFYKTLVEKSSDPLVVNQDNKIVYANPEAARQLGYSPEELIDAPIEDLLPPKFVKKVRDAYRKRMKGYDIAKVYEIYVKTKEGKQMPFEISVEVIDYNNKPAVLAALRNIEERKKAEDIINRKYRKLKKILNKRELGIFETTLAGTIIYVNKSFAALMGYEHPRELVKKKAAELYAFQGERQELLEKLKKKKELHNKVLTFVKADGTLAQFEVTEFLEKNRIIGFLWEHNMNKKEEDLIIVCSYCRKFRNEDSWLQPDDFLKRHKNMIQNTDFDFSHGVCKACKEELLANV